MDRRTSIKWVLAASASWPLLGQRLVLGAAAQVSQGYGTDPNMVKGYQPGDFWPLTLNAAQRHLAGTLADVIIPADEHSPAASTVGVVAFIDEWVSAPYPRSQRDRPVVLDGFAWLDEEGGRRFGKGFGALSAPQHANICDDICDPAGAALAFRAPARFFALFRDLTAAAFYSSPVGRKDLNYIGNVPRAAFEGPPAELLKKLNLP
jgi:hypothetical protein